MIESMDDLEVVDLDRLRKPVAKIKVHGVTHLVYPMDGNAANVVSEIRRRQQEGNVGMDFMLSCARSLNETIVPSMSEEHRNSLSVEQHTAILALAEKQIERVTKMIETLEGNGQGPAPVEEITASPSPAPKSTKKSTRQ